MRELVLQEQEQSRERVGGTDMRSGEATEPQAEGQFLLEHRPLNLSTRGQGQRRDPIFPPVTHHCNPPTLTFNMDASLRNSMRSSLSLLWFSSRTSEQEQKGITGVQNSAEPHVLWIRPYQT